MAVDVLEPDGDGRAGFGRDPAEICPPLVSQDLPEDLLPGAVDGPICVDEGGPRLPGFGAPLKIEVVGVEDDVPALLRQEEMGARSPTRGEPDPAVGVGRLRFDLGVAFLPIEHVEIDRRSGDGPPRRAGQDEHLGPPRDLAASGAGRALALALDHDQVADDDAQADGLIDGAGEILAGRRGDEVEAGGEALREVGVSVMVAVIGAFGEIYAPSRGGPHSLGEQTGLFALGEEVVVLRGADQGLGVEGVSAEEDALEVPMREAHGSAAGRVDAHGLERIVGRFDRPDDMKATLPSRGLGEAFDPFEGDLTGPDEGVRCVLLAGVFGEEGLADGPPGVLAVAGEEFREMAAE
ncbi:MAG: hypothetical protein A2W03_04870 [Candidatus Aminicenantes bacterium RBG_16_63_16]|nr:MAG: hypothetical protein A2W03_04870 [Candidatus Aminicenantes bacterium RBG_16_63_16]